MGGTSYGQYGSSGGGGGGGVTSLNAETGAVVLVAGTNVTITPAGQNITIDASPGTTGNLTDAGTDGITITGGTGAVLGSGTAIAQHVADVSHNGYLSSTDWATFNGKQAALTIGNISDIGTDGITVTGGTGAIIGSGVTLSQHVADTTHNGYLSSTDWNTFNGKQASLTIGNLTDAGTDGITVTGGTGAIIGSGTSIAQHVADATHNGYLSSTDWSTFNGKGSGTVTAVSVASANGFAGTSSGGTTPALTLSTSITGVLKGNGTAISAATAGTDYSAGTSALATGILKSTTSTGVLSIAASGTDFQAPISTNSGASHQFFTAFTAPNTFTLAQPAFTDISGTATVAQTTVGTQALGTLTTTGTVNWANGSVFTATLTSGNACTFTFSSKTSGQTVVIVLTNGSAGGTATVVWPTVKWASGSVPVMSTGTAAIDVYTFVYDGTNVYGSVVKNVS